MNMVKEKYERTELEIIQFLTEDVIMISTVPEEDEIPIMSNPYADSSRRGYMLEPVRISALSID